MSHPFWPPQNVVIRTPRLELRLPTEDEYVELITRCDSSIVAGNDGYPFASDWLGKPAESMQFFWGQKANWKPDHWKFGLCAFVAGEVVGKQDVDGKDFALTRAVSTGSFLLADAQGRGIGTEMRRAVLHFAFAGLGTKTAYSAARSTNVASNAVSSKLGYRITHRGLASFAGEQGEQVFLQLNRDEWQALAIHQKGDIAIEGLEDSIDWFIDPNSEYA